MWVVGRGHEQLFAAGYAAGYAACFQGALGVVGRKEGVDTSDPRVSAEVGIGPEGESYGLALRLTVSIPGVDQAKPQDLTDKAHQVCPYSKATRGNIRVEVVGTTA